MFLLSPGTPAIIPPHLVAAVGFYFIDEEELPHSIIPSWNYFCVLCQDFCEFSCSSCGVVFDLPVCVFCFSF